ncbi:wound-induced protein 1 [Malania oleifera]|uniref:wound-induced protein 1 n=1 Tax=Malania oleifera TaxID=397392 RepID=UPI0025AE3940|nr:wound-induced protein 1 [Malania oleifera]
MMRMLTGVSSGDSFVFRPLSIAAFGPTVLVEGCDPDRSNSWVHAWTVSADGIITQVREYFNTALTVTRFGNSADQSAPSDLSITSHHCPSVWESSFAGQVGKSVPGLVLAI